MLISYAYGWLPVYPPTVRLSVCPPDCPSPFWLPVYPLTGCHRFISQLRVYLSIPQSIHSCFSRHPLTVPRRFNRRLPVYPPDRPSVCLSVCLLSLVFPATLNHHFDRRLSVCPSTIHHRFNHPLPVDPPTARLSVCPSAYPLLFFHQLSVIVSTTSCLSVCLSVLSCFFSSSTDCPSPFQSPTAHLSVCLSVCLSSLVFPPTVNHRFDRRLCVYSPTVCHHFWRRLSAGAGCGWRRTRRADSKKWLRFTVLARLLCFMH